MFKKPLRNPVFLEKDDIVSLGVPFFGRKELRLDSWDVDLLSQSNKSRFQNELMPLCNLTCFGKKKGSSSKSGSKPGSIPFLSLTRFVSA